MKPSSSQRTFEDKDLNKESSEKKIGTNSEIKIQKKNCIEICEIKLVDLALEATDFDRARLNQIESGILKHKQN
jgi:hypothetical protein